tara:strand:- start:236 stop:436 length:201 start_codon:yes stop_codon:yes gene_type:complete
MKKKLKYYGGEGFAYANKIGKFEVRGDKTILFTSLSVARSYYESLNEEKSIWDVTIAADLLECHTY